jgi:hypothetical protein
MASKKEIKRNLNNMVFDIVEECFMIQLMNPAKAEECDAIIDEAANLQDTMLTKINAAKTKADYRPIRAEIENTAVTFIQKLNGLN